MDNDSQQSMTSVFALCEATFKETNTDRLDVYVKQLFMRESFLTIKMFVILSNVSWSWDNRILVLVGALLPGECEGVQIASKAILIDQLRPANQIGGRCPGPG